MYWDLVKVSILFTFEMHPQKIGEVIDKLKTKYKNIYIYRIPYFLNVSMPLIIFDRFIVLDDAIKYYKDIINYYNCKNEILNSKEEKMRHEEVENKWFNGNFNFWILDE